MQPIKKYISAVAVLFFSLYFMLFLCDLVGIFETYKLFNMDFFCIVAGILFFIFLEITPIILAKKVFVGVMLSTFCLFVVASLQIPFTSVVHDYLNPFQFQLGFLMISFLVVFVRQHPPIFDTVSSLFCMVDLSVVKSDVVKSDIALHSTEKVLSFGYFRSYFDRFIISPYFYPITLFILVIFGFLLRIWNLSLHAPFRDELVYLVAAKRYFLEGFFYYDRSRELTYLLGWFFQLCGTYSVFLGRFLMVLLGVCCIVLIYYLGARINRKVGLISAALLTISPWAIGMSRFIREYELYMFIMLVLLNLICYVFDTISLFGIGRTFTQRTRYGMIAIVAGIFLVLFYYYTHLPYLAARRSFNPTFEAVLMFMFGFIMLTSFFIIVERYLQSRQRNIVYLIFIISICCLVYYLLTFAPITFIHTPSSEVRYFDVLYNTQNENKYVHVHQWFENTHASSLFLVIFTLFPLIFIRNKYYFVFLSLVLSYIFGSVYFLGRYFQERYIYFINPFYVILFACSIFTLYSLFGLISLKKVRYASYVLLTIFVLLLFNPFTAINLLWHEEKAGFDYKNGIPYLDTYSLVDELAMYNFSSNSTLITANWNDLEYYYNYSFIRENQPHYYYYTRPFGMDYMIEDYAINVYPFQYPNINESLRLNAIIMNQNEGFIIIDIDRNRRWATGWLPENQTIGNKNLTYLGNFSGFDVFRW